MKSPLSLNTGTVDILLVDLPEDANIQGVVEIRHNKKQFLPFLSSDDVHGDEIPLPPGNWIEVGWSDELTEEQAKGLLFDKKLASWIHDEMGVAIFDDYKKQFLSFLFANNITERKYILVKIK